MKTSLLSFLFFIALIHACPRAWSGEAPPELVKAGMLRNFALLIEWPANAFSNPTDPLVIGILHPDPFGSDFDAAMSTEQVRGRSVRLIRWSSVEEIGDCHLLYIPSSRKSEYSKILERVGGKSVVTVGEDDDLLKLGGLLRFVSDGRRVGFILNAAVERRTGVRISGELKQAAKKILKEK